MSIKIGGQFSGVGSFDMALKRLDIDFENVYQAEWDKYARQTYLLNNEAPKWYVEDVYDTPIQDIPQLDIAMFSPPCQSFSLAGKRQGENSDKGILFYASHEFIEVNKPRYFIFENVKGLLSDDGGKTFQKWIDYLGGKSVNGNHTLFPHEKSVPYHIYYQVMNAKHYGVPQNRERVFIIGIRDDADNDFSFPKPFHLVKRLKDVLESEVDEKYFLSDRMVDGLFLNPSGKNNTFPAAETKNDKDYSACLTSRMAKMGRADNYISVDKIGFINQDTQASQVYSDKGINPSICAGTHGYANGYVETIDSVVVEYQLTGGKWDKTHEQSGRVYDKNGISPTIHTMQGGNQEPKISIPEATKKGFAYAYDGDSFYLDRPHQKRGVVQKNMTSTIKTNGNDLGVFTQNRIRRLTPKECFRLMDFNEDFKWDVSDSQAYKQAGNSIVVSCLVEIIKKLK